MSGPRIVTMSEDQRTRTEVQYEVFPSRNGVWSIERRVAIFPVTKGGSVQWSRRTDDVTTLAEVPQSEVSTLVATLVDWMGYAMDHDLRTEA